MDQIPLKVVAGVVRQFEPTDTIPSANLPPLGAVMANVISTPTTIAADTSYIVVGYLDIQSDLTVLGNVGVL